MKKMTFKDYFVDPSGKIAKRMLYKSEEVIAFMLNIAAGETMGAHTHLTSKLLFQVLEGEAVVITDGLETPLTPGELMQVDGEESLQARNTGSGILRLFVSISPMGSEAFAQDGDL